MHGKYHVPREHTYWQSKCKAWMHCKSLWIKVSVKCIHVNANVMHKGNAIIPVEACWNLCCKCIPANSDSIWNACLCVYVRCKWVKDSFEDSPWWLLHETRLPASHCSSVCVHIPLPGLKCTHKINSIGNIMISFEPYDNNDKLQNRKCGFWLQINAVLCQCFYTLILN